MPGKKIDIKDAVWIAQLWRWGLIEPRFVPTEDIWDLRDLTRYRRKLIQDAPVEKNRIHKILQDRNSKLISYSNDVFGVLGRALLKYEDVEARVKNQVRKKIPSWSVRGNRSWYVCISFGVAFSFLRRIKLQETLRVRVKNTRTTKGDPQSKPHCANAHR